VIIFLSKSVKPDDICTAAIATPLLYNSKNDHDISTILINLITNYLLLSNSAGHTTTTIGVMTAAYY
jgi:hypothetical protein